MSFNDDYLALRKKRLEGKDTPTVKTNPNEMPKDYFPHLPQAYTVGLQEAPVKDVEEEKSFLGTVGDVILGVGEGLASIGEGVTDLVQYGVAGVADLFGADDFADDVRAGAAKNIMHDSYDSMREEFGTKDSSAFGEFGYGVSNALGSIGAVLLTGGVAGAAGVGTGGVTAITTGLTGLSAAGSGMSEAYQGGATDEEAAVYGVSVGAINALTEMISGGLGKAVKAVGVSKGIGGFDDLLAKKVSGKIANVWASNAAQWGVKATMEGAEEWLAGVGQGFAKKMTYMSEEDIWKLWEDEKLLEQFVIGTLASGIVQTPGFISDSVKGKDYVTDLNPNETKVADKEYENRIKAEEESGKKLSAIAKNQIYENVLKDMEKGYISTDTIEQVLGEDDYKAYKDVSDKEEARKQELESLQKEFDELYQMKNGDKSDAQIDRQAEIKQQLEKLKQPDPTMGVLKTQLSNKVQDIVKDSKLAESYNEIARRGQAFQADLSQYDDKQQEVIKKAVESGILNNTNRTHEFVDIVSKISADKGVLFDFTNNKKLKESGFAIDGKEVNGFVTKDGITLNIDSHKAWQSTVGHEITHVMEGTELYAEMQKALFDYAKSKKDFDGRRTKLEGLYKNVKDADIDAELTADLVGDYLFTDENFVKHLSTQNRNVFQKIYDEIKHLWKLVTAGSKEARELEKVKHVFDKVYKESGKTDSKAKDSADTTKYSLSDSDGKQLSKEQSEFFKDSKMRDENGNLKVMYHGSQDAGFHVFDPAHSDDDTSLFFVDRNDVAASYSGTSETYEARTIRSAKDMNDFLAEIGYDHYEAVEKNGKFELLENNDHVAYSDTAQGLYEEFCWYEGVGEGDANYKVYLNLTNPLEIDAKGRPWNKIDAEFSQEVYDRYQSLTAEEKAALTDLAEWEDFRIFNSEIQEARDNELASAYAKMGEDCNIYDLFSVASDNFSEESMRENARKYLNTRDFAQRAKADGYDGVIFKNLIDNGGYSNGSEGASNVAIAFDSNQVKSVANEKPTKNADIRYSLSEDSEGRTLSDEQKKYFNGSKVVDDNGNLKVVYHGSPTDFNTFSLKYLGTNGTNEGYGFYFTDSKRIAEGYSKGLEGQRDDQHSGKLFEVYLDIKKPLSDKEVTIPRAKFRKFLIELNNHVNSDGEPLDILSNYGDVSWEGLNNVLNYAMEIEYDGSDNDVNMVHSVINGCGDKETVFNVLRKVTGYDGIIVEEASWGGDQTIYIAFHPEQIKNVDNRMPTTNPDIRRSLTKQGETPKAYGNYSTPLRELGLDAPMREDVAPVQQTVAEQKQNVSKTAQGFAPMPSEPTSYDLRQEQAELEGQIKEAYKANNVETVERLMERYNELEAQAKRLESAETKARQESLASLTDADAPPEMEAPYYGETADASTDDPFENRDIKAVGDRKVKAYMYENPEVKPFFQEEANIMLGELRDTTKGERFYTPVEGGVPGEYGAESYGVWTGTSRHTTHDLEYLLDTLGYSYAEIEKGLNAIIKDNGAENNACSKRIEFILNNRLMYGYEDITGYPIPANQDYINLLNEKQIKEYSEEARKSFFDVADDYAPQEDIASIAEIKSAPIKEQPNKTAPQNSTGEPVTREVFNKRASEVFHKIKGFSAGKYHKVGDYGFHLARSSAHERATITVKTPDGKKLQKVIDGGNFWKNSRLWGEAAKMVAENEYPNVAKATKPEDVTGKVAKIVTHDTDGAPEKLGFWDRAKKATTKARTHLVDKFSVFEDLALKTGNRELDAKANFMHYSEKRAQHFIGHGADGVRALEDLRQEVEKSGHYDEFHEYMYDMLNTDRMSLEDNAKPIIEKLRGKFENLRMEQIQAIAAKEIDAKTSAKTKQTINDARAYLDAIETRNKPVRGFDYTADVSRANTARLEANYPKFKEWAQDVYKIVEYLREKLVADGEISRETADLWAKIYPHYVPIRRIGKNGNAVNVPLDTNKTGVDAPIKRAVGGDGEIGDLFKTLAMRAEQTFKAGAKNSFGVELKNTLGTTINRGKTSLDEAIDGVENHEERLKKGENGAKPTFTVFDKGERVEFEITEEMYEALRPTSDLFTGTNKALNAATKFQRSVLTQHNPFFMMRNAPKDLQDVLINSQHPLKTYGKIPQAAKELFNYSRGGESKYAAEYFANGAEDLTYFDGQEKVFNSEDGTWRQENNSTLKKVLGFVPGKISEMSDFVERVPRLAEYIASREAGASIEVAMLDAARVTTNFAAGGDVTKWANRNGFTFLNASVQGAMQQVRNIREAKANGLKGMLTLAAKVAVAGLPFVLLNHLMWDDDEEYEELSDYVKENYYIVAKYGDGKFVRIPKGRTLAVIQNAFEQMGNLITGNDEVDLARFGQLLVENLAPNNPLENNVFAPIKNVFENKTWYGDDLVPTRLQDLPNAEQFDETTDAISKWLGETTNTSPYKWNYLLDQYSGVFGDMFLPMLTPQAEGGDNSFGGNLIAPLKDQFTTDSVLKNQNVSDFYDTADELTTNAKSSKATDEDILKYKYMNSVSAELSELYQQKREIQNGDLSDAEKYEAVRELQKQIDELAAESLNSYGNVVINGKYATVGNQHYRWYEPGEDSDVEPGWQKISDKQLEKQEAVTSGLGIDPSTYWSNKSEYDFAYEYPGKYAVAKSVGGYDAYKTYSSELYDIKADKDENGKSISGSRKEKVADYINNLDISYEEKIILFKSEYNADDTYNYEIIEYLNNREDITYEEMVAILRELGFTVNGDTVTWD